MNNFSVFAMTPPKFVRLYDLAVGHSRVPVKPLPFRLHW